jgi:hypothetical protein
MSEFWKRVEAKVKSAALASFLASLLLAFLNATVGHSEVLGGFPPWLQFALITFGPTTATAVAGYRARHTAVPPARDGAA